MENQESQPKPETAANKEASGDRRLSTCSALEAARNLARTKPTKTLKRALVMSAMLDHCRPGEDVDQAASRILADALDATPGRLASALWDCSTLRHGMFTPPQFRRLCEDVLRREMSPPNDLDQAQPPDQNQPSTN